VNETINYLFSDSISKEEMDFSYNRPKVKFSVNQTNAYSV